MFSRRQAGRPSKEEQLDIQIRLLSCFAKHYKITRAAREVGVNRKTAAKYYKFLYGKIIKNKEKEFFEGCRIAKEFAILKISIRIEKLEEQSKIFETKINSLGQNLSPENQWIYVENRKTQEAIAKLEKEIQNLECSPTADLTLTKDVNDSLKKRAELGGLNV